MKANNHPSTMRRLAVSLLVLCASLAAFAQKVSVRGTVTDSRNEPIIGASVLEQGTSNGVATDLDGRFTIQVDRNATLRISYIGCKTRNVRAADNMKVVLEDEAPAAASCCIHNAPWLCSYKPTWHCLLYILWRNRHDGTTLPPYSWLARRPRGFLADVEAGDFNTP